MWNSLRNLLWSVCVTAGVHIPCAVQAHAPKAKIQKKVARQDYKKVLVVSVLASGGVGYLLFGFPFSSTTKGRPDASLVHPLSEGPQEPARPVTIKGGRGMITPQTTSQKGLVGFGIYKLTYHVLIEPAHRLSFELHAWNSNWVEPVRAIIKFSFITAASNELQIVELPITVPPNCAEKLIHLRADKQLTPEWVQQLQELKRVELRMTNDELRVTN